MTMGLTLQAQLVVTTPCPIMIEDTLPCVGFAQEFTLENTGSTPLELAWRKTNISVPMGWTSYLCDPNNCYGPDTNEPISGGVLNTYTMPAGEILESSETSGYVLRYSALETALAGTLIYEMEIYDVNDPSISVTCEVRVTGTGSISTSIQETELQQLTVYPNPATEILFNRAPAEYNARLIDVTGRQLAIIPVNGLDVSQLGAGLYMVSWEKEGQVLKTERILIK